MTLDAINKVVITEDGSSTLYNPTINEHYHSSFGAIQESNHVFIQTGLDLLVSKQKPIKIFEVGFGTGLNALLTYAWTRKNKIRTFYECVESNPISLKLAAQLNYPGLLNLDAEIFLKIHQDYEDLISISENFVIHKHFTSIQEIILPEGHFDLVFFDAFSPEIQPEMWTEDIFKKIALAMKSGGILTTYSSKGIVKRALKAAGFKIEKLPGPPGKREILRAVKSS